MREEGCRNGVCCAGYTPAGTRAMTCFVATAAWAAKPRDAFHIPAGACENETCASVSGSDIGRVGSKTCASASGPFEGGGWQLCDMCICGTVKDVLLHNHCYEVRMFKHLLQLCNAAPQALHGDDCALHMPCSGASCNVAELTPCSALA